MLSTRRYKRGEKGDLGGTTNAEQSGAGSSVSYMYEGAFISKLSDVVQTHLSI